jgi:2-polyprenyl-3-methyl-5-hydroxy-6-metoxy-1,4-benzoquinol methylase
MASVEYVLDTSQEELERLIWQDRMILRPITEKLLRRAGVSTGMRVLDLGCGTGGVSVLAASLVGPSGSVVGIDQSPEAIALARHCALESGLHNVDFQVSSIEDFRSNRAFDAAIGRYALMFQPSPSSFISAAKQHVRRGGIVAFHELYASFGVHSIPTYPKWEMLTKCLEHGLYRAIPSPGAGGRLVEQFKSAGLSCPHIFSEMLVGGGAQSHIFRWLTGVVRTLLPQLLKSGVITEEEVEIDALEERLRRGAIETNAQEYGPPNICAWTTV